MVTTGWKQQAPAQPRSSTSGGTCTTSQEASPREGRDSGTACDDDGAQGDVQDNHGGAQGYAEHAASGVRWIKLFRLAGAAHAAQVPMPLVIAH